MENSEFQNSEQITRSQSTIFLKNEWQFAVKKYLWRIMIAYVLKRNAIKNK